MFSVLMSVYKKENPVYFRQAVESVINQSVTPNEIVIVQDGNLTEELYRECRKIQHEYNELIRFVCLSENVGLGKALQFGIKHCKYELIARMDTDDISKSDRFEKQLAVFAHNEDIVLCGGYIEEFSNDINNVNSIRSVPLSCNEIYKYAKTRNPLNHVTVMFKKSYVLKAGGYLPFYLMEDYYLWIRMVMQGMHMVNLPDVLVSVRADDNMFERRGGIKYFSSEWKLQKKLYSLHFINIYEFVRNVMLRGVIRLLPNCVRRIFYYKFMRREGMMK